MLQVVYGKDVVAVFMNFHGTLEHGPRPRFVIHMDLVGLHLAGIDPRIGLVIVAELEIACDAQSIDGTRNKA